MKRRIVTIMLATVFILSSLVNGRSVSAEGDTSRFGEVLVSSTGTSPTIANGNTSRNLAVGADGTIYAVYHCNEGVYVTKSTNEGASFSAPVQVSATDSEAEIAVSSTGDVYILFQDGVGKIARSVDNGATFMGAVALGETSGQMGGVGHIATDGRYVYVISGSGGTFYRSEDSGMTFTSSTPSAERAFADVHMDQLNNHVILQTDDPSIYVLESSDHGSTFGPELATNKQVYYSVGTISSSETGRFLMVAGQGNTAVKVNLDTDESSVFNVGESVVAQGRSLSADIYGNVVTGYSDGSNVYFSVSQDGGNSFGNEYNVAVSQTANAAINTTNGDVMFLYERSGNVYLKVYENLLTGYKLNVSKSSISFNQDTGFTSDTIRITNNSDVAIDMNSIQATGEFTVDASSVGAQLASGESQNIIIEYTPSGGGTVTGKVEINYGNPAEKKIILLQGTSITVPDAPTNVSAIKGNAKTTVSFDAPSNDGGADITLYTITSNPDNVQVTTDSALNPVVVSGLNNGTSYTFTVVATNAKGDSAPSTASSAVVPEASTTKAITDFNYNGLTPAVNGAVDEGAKTVAVTVPYGTVVTGLVPTITHNGESISPDTGVAQDFTNPVIYSVTAEDGSTQDYIVTVTVANNTEKVLSSFAFAELTPTVTGIVNEGAKTVALTVPFGTDVSNLVATFTSSDNSTVKIGDVVQMSGTTGNDFSNPVTYTVTAEDGSTQNYTVTVTDGPSTEKAITLFNFAGLSPVVTGTVDEGNKAIALRVPHGTAVNNLVATFTSSVGSTVKIGNVVQTSGTTSNDFTNPITYTVTAEDGSTEDYTVTVTVTAAPTPAPAPSSPNGSSESSGITTQEKAVIIVNGKEEKAGEENVVEKNGEKLVTIDVDTNIIEEKMNEVIEEKESAPDKNIIEVSVTTSDANQVKTVLTGDIVKLMEDNDFDLAIKSKEVNYMIPAKEVGIDKVAAYLGVDSGELVDIKVDVIMKKSNDDLKEKIEKQAKDNGQEMIIEPLDFEVVAKTRTAQNKEKEVTISKFNRYVERGIKLPDGIDPSKITTGIVYNEDGTFSHVPTTVTKEGDEYFAKISSLTNSSYTVIWNPITVEAVENHWSKEAVNNMASRLVIGNPEDFKPDDKISRAEFAVYITKAIGVYRTDVTNSSQFSDVKEGHEYEKAIEIAANYGIIKGYDDGTFKPEKLITREEAMTMFARAIAITELEGEINEKINRYTDKDKVADWAYESVEHVVSANVFNGKTESTINPKDTFTYAEAATAIQNLLVESGLINN